MKAPERGVGRREQCMVQFPPVKTYIGNATTLPISKQAADVSREAFQIGKVAHLATGDRQHGQAVEHKLITSTCIAVDVAELFVVA